MVVNVVVSIEKTIRNTKPTLAAEFDFTFGDSFGDGGFIVQEVETVNLQVTDRTMRDAQIVLRNRIEAYIRKLAKNESIEIDAFEFMVSFVD